MERTTRMEALGSGMDKPSFITGVPTSRAAEDAAGGEEEKGKTKVNGTNRRDMMVGIRNNQEAFESTSSVKVRGNLTKKNRRRTTTSGGMRRLKRSITKMMARVQRISVTVPTPSTCARSATSDS